MRSDIKNIINDIYCDNNSSIFIQGCSNKIDFLDDLLARIEKLVDNVELISSFDEPVEEINISVNIATINDISIKYDSILYINKIVKYFYLQHEFSMDNPDTNGMDPCLDGFRDDPYSKKQFSLDEMIVDYLTDKGYSRLSNREMEEVFPKLIKIHDSDDAEYITVNNALFMDYYGFFE